MNALRGLTLDEARIALEETFLDHDPLDEACVADVIRFKRQVILKLGVLQFVETRVTPSSVGGLDALKAWLEVHPAAFGAAARRARLPPPKGLLVMGIPRCGKSLSVQLVAGAWELPLLRLDLATVHSGALGNPERRSTAAWRWPRPSRRACCGSTRSRRASPASGPARPGSRRVCSGRS